MLYVKQSLSPSEKIVAMGEFHWAYTAAAISWIFIGIMLSYVIIHVGLHMDVHSVIDKRLPNLPESLEQEAWNRVIKAKGGILNAIWDLNVWVRSFAALALVFGIGMFVRMMIVKYVTEIAITTHRLIYKTGLVARYVGEISVDRIEGINVVQSVFGRLLGYGQVVVRGMGVGEVVLPPIEDPIRFRRAIDKARTL